MKRVSLLGLAACTMAALAFSSCDSGPKLNEHECLIEYTNAPKEGVVFATFGPDNFNTDPADTLSAKDNKIKIDYTGKAGEVYAFLQRGAKATIFFAPQQGGVVFQQDMLKGKDSAEVMTFKMKDRNLSEANKSFEAYNMMQAKFQLRDLEINNEAEKLEESKMDSLRKVYQNMKEDNAKQIKDFVLNNKNLAGLFAFFINSNDLKPYVSQIAPIIEGLPESEMKQKAVELIGRFKRVDIGQKFVDFGLPTPDGDTLRLSDFAGKGKPVLLDFWASWCGPCRKENPHLVEAYKEFHPKGFEIFAVSLDQNKENWLKGMKDDGLTWPQVSSLQAWQCPVREIYTISGIPNNLLLDGDGIIVAKSLHGDDLKKKLQELLP